MKKTTFLKDMLIVSLVICIFAAIGGAVNGQAVACLFLIALSCFLTGIVYNRKKIAKNKKCVNLSHNSNVKHAA